jgi:hypothetical protein
MAIRSFSRPAVALAFGRQQTFLRGIIYTPAPVICAVRGLGHGGATLLVPSSSVLPRQFRLLVESVRLDVNCELIEQCGSAVEVFFTRPCATQKKARRGGAQISEPRGAGCLSQTDVSGSSVAMGRHSPH